MSDNSPRQLIFVLAASYHGPMIVSRVDFETGPGGCFGVGATILRNGEYDPGNVKLTRFLLEARRKYHGDGVVAIDVGANHGVFTIEWAKLMTGWGSVLALEPQEWIFYALAGNIALNNCTNAKAILGGAGLNSGTIEIPVIDYSTPRNFGGVALGDGEGLVPIHALDDFKLARVDLLKIDVEGMELDVLAGAPRILLECRPAILIEFHIAGADKVRTVLESYGYKVMQTGNMDFVAVHKDDPIAKHIAQDPNDSGAR